MLNIYFHIIASLILMHDFHVSKTILNYKSDQESMQITVHVFIDDLELALKNYDSNTLNLFTTDEYPNADSLISIYINEHLKIQLDSQAIEPVFLGKEISEDLSASWCYLESLNIKQFKNMDLSVSIFNKQFDDQRNIVDIKLDSKSSAFEIMDVKNSTKHISF